MAEALFDIKMKHSEESLLAVSHMQYNLFCTRNFVARSILSAVVLMIGAYNFRHVWGLMLIAYGSYLMTSKYSASNHQVRKLTEGFKKAREELPSSRYRFFDKQIEITYRPGKKDEETLDPLSYDKLIKLGEDADYFFLFPHSQGGYCIPKKALAGKENAFRDFVEQKTGQRFYRRRPSPLQRLTEWMRKRENEPEHL